MLSAKTKINPDQKKVVDFDTGSLLVVAGAGTGKTRVIAERIKNLVQKMEIKPKEILALTFTDKASEEMLGRVDDIMPLGYEEPWINTFHSFADRLLKLEGLEIGLDPSFKIMPYSEQWILFRKNLFKFELEYFRPLGNPTKFISAILKFISRLQDENISTEEFENFAKSYKGDPDEKKRWLELSKTYKKYEELKLENSVMDFGDLILWSIKLFQQRSNILKKYQTQFKHVLVDEFQDTNHAQYELLKLLCPANELNERSYLVVGDDSQSIYKFRGAAVSNILEFMKDYPDSEMVTLLKNYRSDQKILDGAYKLIQNNNPDTLESKLNISKELVSQVEKAKTQVQTVALESMENEVEYVVKKILELLATESGLMFKDIAILARANSHLDPFIFALRGAGIPYQVVGNRGLYDREEIRDVLSLLKIIVNPNDGVSVYRALNIDSLEVPAEEISRTLSMARANKTGLWEEILKNPKLEIFRTQIMAFQDSITKLSPSEFLYKVVNETNYISTYLENETVETQMSIKNLDIFLNKAKQFEAMHKNETREIPTIIDFIDYIELLIEAGDNPAQAEMEDYNTVNLMTVHASKGLEFDVVFMTNLVSDRFPTRNRKDVIDLPDEIIKESLPSGDAHIQEERRLFYVGMTRAKKYLYLTWAKNYGGKREKRKSGFLDEIGVREVEISEESLKSETQQVGLFGVESGFREPKAEKIKSFVPAFLSYTQVDNYKTCPLKYKYSYVLNIPQAPSSALSFGNTIHATMRDFHTKLMFGAVTLDELLEIYERNWDPTGYMSAEHREKQFESGKKLLAKYFAQVEKMESKPIELEKSFNIRIDGIKFYGRIDRIDKHPDGSIEIVDYKTGQPKTQKDVDNDEQVNFYAIGAKEALGYTPDKLSLYFLESGEKITTTRDDLQLIETKREVIEVVKKMKTGDFKANPGMHCKWCAYREICPFADKI